MLALALMVISSPVGCNGIAPRSSGPYRRDDAVRWPYWPTQMRIHPLSRVSHADGASVATLDLRVETADADGIEGRAVGIMRVTAVSRDRRSAGNRATIELTLDLADPAVNRRIFDAVTRTHHVRLQLDWPEPPAADSIVDVTVVLDSGNRRSLRARAPLRWE